MGALITARFIFFYIIAGTNTLNVLGQLEKIGTSCTCPGDIITYHCVINATVAGGFTIWQGLAFECLTEGNRILLRHNSFRSGAFGSCSGGSLTGRSLPTGAVVTTETNYIYTSQLQADFNSNPSLIGRPIECVYNPNGNTVISIGTATIDITDPIPPPGDVQLVEATPSKLTFGWSSAQDGCSTLRYQIESNCGSCSMNPSSVSDTTLNSATCSIEPVGTADNFCTFSVRTVVCNNNITGNLSIPVTVNLKVPNSPEIQSAIPSYNEKGHLTNVQLEFANLDSFQISQGIDGSPLYYIVNISDAMTNDVCQSKNVSATLCNQGVCSVTSNNLSNNCSMSANVNASVIAINRLGQSQSNYVLIQNTNSYVNVMFEQNGRIVCTFPESPSSGQNGNDKSCVVMYGSCDQELTTSVRGIANSSNTVIINFLQPPSSYCYTVNANNGTFAVQIQGMFSQGTSQLSTGGIIAIIAIVVILISSIMVAVALLVYCKCRNYRSRPLNSDSDSQELTKCLLKSGYEEKSDSNITVLAHISFDVEDKPQELTSALNSLNSQSETDSTSVNIKNINICGHASEKPQANLKTVYIECEDNLNDEEVNTIEDRIKRNQHVFSVKVHKEAKEVQVPKDRDHDSRYVKEIREVLKNKPGALSSLLEVFNATEECKHINITDIVVEPLTEEANNEHKQGRVTIKFIPELARDWKEKYNMKKNECEFIVPMPEEKTRSVSMSTSL